MAHIDYQQVVVRFRALVASKPNHGQRDLLSALALYESQAMMDEDAYRAFLSRFGEEVEEAVLNTLPVSDEGLTPSVAVSAVAIQARDHTPIAHPGHDEGERDGSSNRRVRVA